MEFMPEYAPLNLPAAAKNPQLLITDAGRMTSLLIGHENGPFHKKIFFRLTSAISRRGREPSQTHSSVRVWP